MWWHKNNKKMSRWLRWSTQKRKPKTYLREKDVPLITLIDAEKKTKTHLRKSVRSAGKCCPADYADRRRKENQNLSAEICEICGKINCPLITLIDAEMRLTPLLSSLFLDHIAFLSGLVDWTYPTTHQFKSFKSPDHWFFSLNTGLLKESSQLTVL